MFKNFIKLKSNETITCYADEEVSSLTEQTKFLKFWKDKNGDRTVLISIDQIAVIEYYKE